MNGHYAVWCAELGPMHTQLATAAHLPAFVARRLHSMHMPVCRSASRSETAMMHVCTLQARRTHLSSCQCGRAHHRCRTCYPQACHVLRKPHGGLQHVLCAARPAEALPADLQRICDEAAQLVYVSFGSTATAEPELVHATYQAVTSVNASTIWKVC